MVIVFISGAELIPWMDECAVFFRQSVHARTEGQWRMMRLIVVKLGFEPPDDEYGQFFLSLNEMNAKKMA